MPTPSQDSEQLNADKALNAEAEDGYRCRGRPCAESLSARRSEIEQLKARAAEAEAAKAEAESQLRQLQGNRTEDTSDRESEDEMILDSGEQRQTEQEGYRIPDLSGLNDAQQGKRIIESLVNAITGSFKDMTMDRQTPELIKLDVLHMDSREFHAWQKQWESYTQVKELHRLTRAQQVTQLQLFMTPEICDQLDVGYIPSVKKILEAVSDYLLESVNVTIQRKCFYERQQRKGESVAVFMMCLRELARDCEFRGELDDQIKD